MPAANFNGSESFSWNGSDGSAYAATDATVNITVNPVNDAPVNAVPGIQSTSENAALVFSSANGNQISISDVDAGSNSVQVTLTATDGTLSLGNTAGLSVTGNGTATVTISGGISDINARLEGTSFVPAAGFAGTATVQVTTNDQGNSGSGGALSDVDSLNVTVKPTVTLTAGDRDAAESGSDPGIFIVTRSGSTADPLTVFYSIATGAGQASNTADYSTLSGSVIIPAGASTAAIDIIPVNDTDIEGDETVTLSLTSDAAYTVGVANTDTVTIADDDVTVNIAATTANTAEGSATPAQFTVTLNGAIAANLTVNYSITGGSATQGTDYNSLSGSVTILAGSTAATIDVTAINDAVAGEGSETVELTLSPSVAYSVGTAAATVAIADNELTFNAPVTGGSFGSAVVALNTSELVIGAPTANSRQGSAYKFNLAGATPTTSTLAFSSGNPLSATYFSGFPINTGGLFGSSLAFDGTNLLIGQPEGLSTGSFPASGFGRAYLFNPSSSTPTQTFNNPTATSGDTFGLALAAQGGNYLIGAPQYKVSSQDVGQVYLTGGSTQTFNNPETSNGAEFGSAVAFAGANFLIAAPEQDVAPNDNAGKVRLLDSSGAVAQTMINPNPAGTDDRFGFAIASNSAGTRFLIGAPGEDMGGTDAGAVYLYDNTATLLHTFTNPDASAGSGFGTAVAFAGDDILIGAPGKFFGSGIAPVNGKAYLFDDEASAAPYARLQTFNNPTGGNDGFGASLTAAGSSILIGAPFENTTVSSGSTPVIADGAAYLFNFG